MYKPHLNIKDFDPELWAAMVGEARREEECIELIASENYASSRVLEAQGSIFTNKYAEGYPKKRYYGGCEYVDVVEQLAIDRVKQLFNVTFANVQPHSGSQANAAVLMALLEPGDILLGMNITHGGHLTHGSQVNFSGKLYRSVSYGINLTTGEIDYDQVEKLAYENQPRLIIAGFSAYSRKVDWQRFREIADSVNAYLLADIAHVAGLVAAGLYPSPVDYADVITSTTHKTLRGPRGGIIMAKRNPDMEKRLNSVVFPGTQGGPLVHVIAAKAVAFQEALQPEFKVYQQQILTNARLFAMRLMDNGFDVVSGGTDNHMFLLDLIKKNITGKDAEAALNRAHITLNKNSIPNDPRPPQVTSGVRIGTPAITTRGFKEPEVEMLVSWMVEILNNLSKDAVIEKVRQEVLAICKRFPVYQ